MIKLGFIAENDISKLACDCRFAAEHGYSGLEFNFWGNAKDLTLDTVKGMKAILDTFCIECSSLGLWGWNHTSTNHDERTAALVQLDKFIEFAQVLDAKLFMTGGGQIEGGYDANLAAFGQVFPGRIAKLEEAGIPLAMYAVHGASFLDSMEAYEKLWAVYPTVGMKIDPANLRGVGIEYLPFFRDHAKMMYEVHIKEAIAMDGNPWASQPAAGMGDIAWGKIFAFLYESDWEKYMVVEPHGQLWGVGERRWKMLKLTQRHISQFII
ncbi:MAG: sugar phosphate isomerase/epimerase family protein [Anaerolineae bacterium]|jgi:sugar phosphate isomerase/epimerase